MPSSVVITIAPEAPLEVPAVLGRALHAWTIDCIAAVDSGLAAELHDGSGLKPLTVSELVGAGRARDGLVMLRPDRPVWFRLTALRDDIEAVLDEGLPAVGVPLGLEGANLHVCAVARTPIEHRWAGSSSYSALIQRHTLASTARPRAVMLRYVSPTVFRVDGHDLPLPRPDLVFGSYLQRWNAFSPRSLPAETRRYAQECVALGKFQLRSRFVSFERGGKGGHVGFTGQVRFRFLVGDGYWTRLMRLLAAFAFFCGTGYRTTVGLGQTTMMAE